MHLQMAFFRVHVVGNVIFEDPFPVEGMMMNMSFLFFRKRYQSFADSQP